MLLRPLSLDDAPAVALLSGQLGYPATPAHARTRLKLLLADPDGACFAADVNQAVVGWVHVYGVHLLESPASFAEIGGLIVDAGRRRGGIGRALMRRAEAWAAAQGYSEVRLRSGLHRTDAHQFYHRIGYTLAKTSHLFCKALTGVEEDGETLPRVPFPGPHWV